MVRQFDIWARGMTRGRFTWNDLIEKRTARCWNSACWKWFVVETKSVSWCSHTCMENGEKNEGSLRLLPPKLQLSLWGAEQGCSQSPIISMLLSLCSDALRGSMSRSMHSRMITLDRKHFPCISLGISSHWGAEPAGCSNGPAVVHCTSCSLNKEQWTEGVCANPGHLIT